MCCFSRPVELVANTNIFARPDNDEDPTRQLLAYSMDFRSAEALAMVLPLPVVPGAGEDAVRFVDLSRYARFFVDLRGAFAMEFIPFSRGGPVPEQRSRPRLKVHAVGEFEASFVPTIADFDRLDPRFRLPDGVWDGLPAYRDYGFAVFKLRPRRGLLRYLGFGAGKRQTVHPMALSFPRRDPSRLFFPTVHVHDGTVPETARFDHTLYLQGPAAAPSPEWGESLGPLGRFMLTRDAGGMIDADAVGFRRTLVGPQANADVTVAVGG